MRERGGETDEREGEREGGRGSSQAADTMTA